jgi:hypothetical protein
MVGYREYYWTTIPYSYNMTIKGENHAEKVKIRVHVLIAIGAFAFALPE